MIWSDKVYWQVADTRRRASEGLVSSRSTQLGKEDFWVVVIVPTGASGAMDDDEADYIPLTY